LEDRELRNEDATEGDHDHFAPPPPPSNTDYRHARWPRFGENPQAEIYRPKSRPSDRLNPGTQSWRKSPDVLVVGVCSAGKSTLVRKLKDAGYDARACAQEHSYVPHLWQLSRPGALVYLDAGLNTVRQRRRVNWTQSMLDEQHRRLGHAREHCDLYIGTDWLSPDEVASQVMEYLKGLGLTPARQ
jgi:hypothetical protein